MNDEIFEDLVDQYLTGTISPEGKIKLAQLLEQPKYRQELELLMEETFRSEVFLNDENPKLRSEIQDWLRKKITEAEGAKTAELQSTAPVKKLRGFKYAAAAAIILMLGIGSYFAFLNNNQKNDIVKTPEIRDIKPPASAKAVITLANGQQIVLDSAGNGTLATQGNVNVVKLADGKVAYQTAGGEIIKKLEYNTLSNPRGSKVIDMMLSDGSHVWLNSGSSITFPIAFVGEDRKITVDGEAYFEVTHNALRPFIVSKGETSVRVLGTHFNVNAYSDEEDIKVTLLEGSVKVSKGNASGLLIPGQEARINENIKVKDVDVDEVISWKVGIFLLDNTDLPTIMRQISRWYDVNVVYEGKVPSTKFGGGVSKDQPLSKILEILERYGLHFELDGKTLKVK